MANDQDKREEEEDDLIDDPSTDASPELMRIVMECQRVVMDYKSTPDQVKAALAKVDSLGDVAASNSVRMSMETIAMGNQKKPRPSQRANSRPSLKASTPTSSEASMRDQDNRFNGALSGVLRSVGVQLPKTELVVERRGESLTRVEVLETTSSMEQVNPLGSALHQALLGAGLKERVPEQRAAGVDPVSTEQRDQARDEHGRFAALSSSLSSEAKDASEKANSMEKDSFKEREKASAHRIAARDHLIARDAAIVAGDKDKAKEHEAAYLHHGKMEDAHRGKMGLPAVHDGKAPNEGGDGSAPGRLYDSLSNRAYGATNNSDEATMQAQTNGTKRNHREAVESHGAAADAHHRAEVAAIAADKPAEAKTHAARAESHEKMAARHMPKK